jgi:hypothetical protein
MTSAGEATAAIANLNNKDADWNAFDPEGYFQHYYGDPHPDDDALTYLAARALRSVACSSRSLDIVDVGTGPSLIPLLAALPVATRLTAWEYSKPNLEWLAKELTGPTLRPQWQHFWQRVKAAHSLDGANASPMLPHDPLPPLVQRTRLLRGSIFDLPPRTFDAATMFFCAESITSNTHEFQTAVSAFTETVRPGGLIAAAFLAGSSGYEVSGRRYPAVAIDTEDIAACLVGRVQALEFTPIGLSSSEIRSGYCGAIFVTGCVAA